MMSKNQTYTPAAEFYRTQNFEIFLFPTFKLGLRPPAVPSGSMAGACFYKS